MVALPVGAEATAVTGEVYDIRSGAVVPGAVVALGGEETESREDGTYRIIAGPRRRDKLVAEASGYVVTVMEYMPVVPTPPEVWYNVPLMPRDTATPYEGSFSDLFFGRAPLRSAGRGYVVARRLDDLPLMLYAPGLHAEEEAALTAFIGELNERWGTDLFAWGSGPEARVVMEFGAAGFLYEKDGAGRIRTAFPDATGENALPVVEAFLRQLVLAGDSEAEGITEAGLRADVDYAEDLDAVVRIIYRESEDFNYGVFKRRAPSPFSILTDLYLGIGGYDKTGVTDETGDPVDFPTDYQLGQVSLAGGAGYRNFWVKAGFWFAGIWEVDAEELYSPGGVAAEEVLRRNFSTYYRGGYWLWPVGAVRAGPFAGYRTLRIRGKHKSPAVPEAVAPAIDLDYTDHYDGAEAGIACDVAPGWYNVGFTAEYARVFDEDGYNLFETGFGVVNRIGAGTFGFVRFYWGPAFKYTFAGLAMKIDVPL